MPHPSKPADPAILPTIEDMLSVWRADRCVQDHSAAQYLQWVRRFRKYCEQHKLDERAELTLEGARRFIVWYAQQRLLDVGKLGAARNALRALSRVHQVTGLNPPIWQAPQPAPSPASALLGDYGDHLARRRGNPAVTVHKKQHHIGMLWEHISGQGKTWSTMALTDIDAFLVACAQRYARSTTAGIAGSVRSFTHFLLATGHISIELADSVIAPVQPKHERPRRALPWEDAASVCFAPWTSPQREDCATTRSCWR